MDKGKNKGIKESNVAKLNVNISKDLHNRLKHRAIDEDVTLTELTIKIIEDYLKRATKNK